MKVLAQFECACDKVKLLTDKGEQNFRVEASWLVKNATGWATINHTKDAADLREARIDFEQYVNDAISRMTLGRMYALVGQSPPVGPGKYGLPMREL